MPTYSPFVTVNNMIARDLKGVEFLVCNTDAQHLSISKAQNTIQLGRAVSLYELKYFFSLSLSSYI